MHRLSRVETERVMAVMDSTINKLDILSCIQKKKEELKLKVRHDAALKIQVMVREYLSKTNFKKKGGKKGKKKKK